MQVNRMRASGWMVVALACALCACDGPRGGDGAGQRPDGAQDPLLPVPQAGRSGVTGMPDAGAPGPQAAPTPDAPAVAIDAEGNPVLPDAVADADAPGTDTGDDGPGADAAVGVLRDYYAALNAGNHPAAYGLWADGGRASNQSPEGFAQGFADTRGISVELGAPSAVDGAAGNRFVEVPVTLLATQADGTQRRYRGLYSLRRSLDTAAAPGQAQWRISGADLREEQP